jgi:hypothetical protein
VPLVTFEVRIRDHATLDELRSRVDAALGISLSPSDSRMLRDTKGLQTETLGVDISLHFWPPLPEGQLRTYRLIGYSAEDVKLPWTDAVDLSEYILRVLKSRDSDQWFIPTPDERYSDMSGS